MKMKTMRISVDPTVHLAIKELCDALNDGRVDYTEELTPVRLLEMLAQDAGYASSRPGSWEGANMLDLLRSHGYGL